MAPSEKRGSHEEDAIYRRADGGDPPRGGSAAHRRGGEEARRQRSNDLRVAETIRRVGAGRCEAPPAARAGKQSTQEDGGGSRSRDRRPQGDHAKKMVGARVRRQQVAYARSRGLSGRRACALLSVARSMLGYVSRLIARDAPVLPAVRTLAGQYPRYGYRTIRIFLEREGHRLGTDRMYRLWRQEGLQVPKKRPRRRVATGRPRPLAPTAVNHVWAYDFVFDTCADGRTLKCLTVIDEFTRECLAIDVAGGIRSGRVIDVLAQLVSVHGAPRHLRSDNGPEFVATAILRGLQTAQIETAFIDPGKPWQNGADESFNGKFRDQHLSLQWFRNRVDAKVSIEQWRRHYNEVRPHSSLAYLTPAALKAKHLAESIDGRRSDRTSVVQGKGR